MKYKGQEARMLVECKKCEAVVDAVKICSYIKRGFGEQLYLFKYSLLKCPRCESPLLISQESNIENFFLDHTRIYPLEDKQVNPFFPESIRSAYQEALFCFKAKAFTAASIMCRKTLEGICNVHGIHLPNLASGLKEMKDNKIIEGDLFEWANALRIFGNDAAHDVNVTISSQDAKDIIEFTDALLEYVFTYREKFSEFNKRRSKRP